MERVPQWSHEETLELLKIRAEMDKSFMETKRNKLLWETVSMRMRLLAFPRTAEQCKSKWKNLLTRFKGSEAMEVDAGRQFPFHEEMQRIFSERMVMRLDDHEGKGKEVVEHDQSSDDDDHHHHEEKYIYDQKDDKKKKKRRRRKDGYDEVVEVLKEIVRRQGEMEERWMKEEEEREEERRVWEEDWRRTMEELLVERMEMERRWREREEERKARDEAMADRRHSLLTAILTKLSDKL